MLKNAYLLAKIGADTAENERNFVKNLPKIGNYPQSAYLGSGRQKELAPRTAPLAWAQVEYRDRNESKSGLASHIIFFCHIWQKIWCCNFFSMLLENSLTSGNDLAVFFSGIEIKFPIKIFGKKHCWSFRSSLSNACAGNKKQGRKSVNISPQTNIF